jgi:dTDP-4-dehydrorhamnose 3,5-epimerase
VRPNVFNQKTGQKFIGKNLLQGTSRMKFQETELRDALIIDLTKFEDERGYFVEAWRQDLAEKQGILDNFTGINMSFNRDKGTLRGLHAQKAPHAQAKLVRCLKGAIMDVIVDIRPDSPTYLKWISVELTGENLRILYVPEGFLHGFQTLADDTTVMYQVSGLYHPQSEIGACFDDPAFNIVWPDATARIISDKDQKWPHFEPQLARI